MRSMRYRSFLRTSCLTGILLFNALTLNTAFGANGSVAYTYDALGRVITASYDTGVCIRYSYDANGNRLTEIIAISSSGNVGVWGCFNWNAGGGAVWGQ